MSRYDRQGRPISVERWNFLAHDDGYRILQRTTLGPPGRVDQYRVSTAWTGLNVDVSGIAPLIFKTLASGDEGEEYEYDWATEEAARAGHAAVVHDLGAQLVEEGGTATIREIPPLLNLIKEHK